MDETVNPNQQPQQPMGPPSEGDLGPLGALNKPNPDLLASVPDPKKYLSSDDEEAIRRRSSMYALSKATEYDASKDTMWDNYASAIGTYAQTIKALGDHALRNDAELEAMTNRVNSLAEMANNAQTDPTLVAGAKQALVATLQERAAQKAHDAAERKWAESVTALRDNNQDYAAELSIMQHDTPDVWDNLIDIQTVRGMMMRKIEEAGTATKDRNWLFWLMDTAMYMLPFGTTAAHTNTYDTKHQDFLDFVMSGRRFSAETNSAWNAALSARTADERQAVVDSIFSHINDNVTPFFGSNELLRMQIMGEYMQTPDANDINMMDSLQNLPIFGTLGAMSLKAFSTPFKLTNVLKGFGGSGRARKVVEEVAEFIKANGPEAAEAKYGKGIVQEAQDNLTPGVMDPSTVRIGAEPIDLAQQRAQINRQMDAVEANDALSIAEKEEELGLLRDQLKALREPPTGPSGGPPPVKPTVTPLNMGADANEVNIAGASLPKANNPAPGYYGNLSIDAAKALEDGEQALKNLVPELQVIQRLNDSEKEAALADLVERASRFGVNSRDRKRVVINQRMDPFTTANGSEYYNVYMTIGKAVRRGDASPWYVSKTEAMNQAKRIGVSDYEVVTIADGQYGLEIRLPLDESGKSLGGARIYTSMTDKERSGPLAGIARYLGSPAHTQSKELIGAAHLSFDKRNKILGAIKEKLLPKFFALNKEEKDVLSAVLVKGERDKVWYTEHELDLFYAANFGTKSNPSKFVEAYWTAKEINDIDYYLRNAAEFVTLHSQGAEKFIIPGVKGNVNGKIFRSINQVPEEAIWDTEANTALVGKIAKSGRGKYAKDTRLTMDKLNEKFKNGYVLIRTFDPQKMFDGAQVRYFLAKGSKIVTSNIDFEQIPYYPGGHRMYKANYFIKMGRTGKQPWDEEFLDSPFTPTAALTRAEGVEWADNANKLRLAYKDAVDAKKSEDQIFDAVDQVMRTIDGNLDYPSTEEFVGWMKQHGHKNPFEVVFDRELPSMYSGATDSGYGGWAEPLSGTNTYMQTQGKMFVSRKGSVLPNIRSWNESAETYDPFETLNSAMGQIAKLSSFTDFKIRAIQKWITTYEGALDLTGLEGANPVRVFMNARFRTGTKDLQSIKTAAELQRSIIRRQLGWKSDWDVGVENATRRFGEWMAGEKVGIRSKAVHAVGDWWTETKPVSVFQGLAYDATMGLFNIAQFPLQVQTSWIAYSIDPVKGGHAFVNLPGIWAYMAKGGSEETLKYLTTKGMHTLAGYKTAEEYMEMMRTLKRTGVLDNMLGALKNEMGPNAALGMVGKTASNLRDAGRFFTDKAEEINRMNAWQIAWQMIRERNPAMDYKSPLFVERVRKLTSTLFANMDEASAAAWQRNSVTKIPTQFMPYMARWHELLVSPDLTVPQKLKFVAGQAFMYGRAGLPFAAYFLAEQQKVTGTTPKMGTAEGAIDRGFADTLIWYATGLDITFSERAGIGNYPTDLIQEFFGGGRYGETSAADILMGASGQIWGAVYDASFEALKYASLETGGEAGNIITERTLKRLARSVSTLNNVFKAEAIMNYGQYTNRKGEAILDELPSTYGVAALFGLAPAELQELTAQKGFLEKRKERVDQWTEALMINRVEFGNAMKDGDYERAREIGATANLLGKLMPKDIKADVFDQAYRDPRTRTVAESIGERYDKEISYGKLIKRNEQQ
jgi:hypothetical protein